MDDRLFSILPFLDNAESETARLMQQYGRAAQVGGGQFIAMEGQDCDHMAFLVEGSVRVFKSGESGREITLYRLEPGESCILTASSILSNRSFPAHAVTEGKVEAVMVPAAAFRDWVERFDVWRRYVFDLLTRRLATVIAVIDEVAFRRLDARLATYLVELSGTDDDSIRTTHEAIAADLGSSREVVSRLLKDFERANLVALSRGRVVVRDREALRSLSAPR